jgi:hypothetical protein
MVQDREVAIPATIVPALIEAAKLVSQGDAFEVVPVDDEEVYSQADLGRLLGSRQRA